MIVILAWNVNKTCTKKKNPAKKMFLFLENHGGGTYGRRRLKRYAEPVLNNRLCNSVKAAGRMTNDLFSGILKAGFKKCEVVFSWWSSFVFTGSCGVPRQR
jgi:hypothetical protein